MSKPRPAPKPPCSACNGSGRIGVIRTFHPITGAVATKKRIPCPTCK